MTRPGSQTRSQAPPNDSNDLSSSEEEPRPKTPPPPPPDSTDSILTEQPVTKGKPQPPKMYALKRDAADQDTACLVANLLFGDRAKLIFAAHGSADSKKIAFANSLFSLTSGPLRDNGLHRKPEGTTGMVGFAKRLVKQFRDIGTAVGDHGDGAEADTVEEPSELEQLATKFIAYEAAEKETRALLAEQKNSAAEKFVVDGIKDLESNFAHHLDSESDSAPAQSSTFTKAPKKRKSRSRGATTPGGDLNAISSMFAESITSIAPPQPPPPPPTAAAPRVELVAQLASLRELMEDDYVDEEEKEDIKARMKVLRQRLIELAIV